METLSDGTMQIAMMNPDRQEVLQVIAELSELAPEVRLGQLIVNLSYLARGLANESVWDMDELLAAAGANRRNGGRGSGQPRHTELDYN